MPSLRLIRLSALLAAFPVAASILAGCGSTSSAPPGILRLSVAMVPKQADPARADTPAGMWYASLMYSGLVKFAPDLHVIPELAVSIPTISSSGKTYTFTVRQDARFADGHHCTATDVSYSLARALSPAVSSPLARRYLGNIVGAAQVENGSAGSLSGVRVLNRLTVRIHLFQPDADFLQKLAFPVAAIVDHRSHGPVPSGLGPWILGPRSREGSVTLFPRPRFYGGSLQLKALVLTPVRDSNAAFDLYRRNSLDASPAPLARFRALMTRSDFQQSNALDAYYAVPRTPDAVALAAHLDRDQLVRDATPALSPLNTIVPPAIPDYVSSAPNLDPPAGANGLSPLPHVSIRAAPSDDLADTLRRGLLRQWPSARRSGNVVDVIHSWFLLPDPGVWLRLVLPWTPSHWYRSTLAQASKLTNDPVSRMSSYSTNERWALEKALVIPLASGTLAYLVKPTVHSLQVTPLGLMPQNDNWSLVSVS